MVPETRAGLTAGMSALVVLLGLGATTSDAEDPMATPFQLKSTAFQDGTAIPAVYTCDGRDISPPLDWGVPPEGTNSLALISDDPDAPAGTWVHWVIYNLPPTLQGLPEAFPKDAQRPDGTRQGNTDFRRTGYGGPCPPSGTHRYFFKLYSLDTMLSVPPGATARQLEQAMQGHIVAEARLMGTYARKP